MVAGKQMLNNLENFRDYLISLVDLLPFESAKFFEERPRFANACLVLADSKLPGEIFKANYTKQLDPLWIQTSKNGGKFESNIINNDDNFIFRNIANNVPSKNSHYNVKINILKKEDELPTTSFNVEKIESIVEKEIKVETPTKFIEENKEKNVFKQYTKNNISSTYEEIEKNKYKPKNIPLTSFPSEERQKQSRWIPEKEILLTKTITTTKTTNTTTTTNNNNTNLLLSDDPIIREAIRILEDSCQMLSETERRIRDANSGYVNTNEKINLPKREPLNIKFPSECRLNTSSSPLLTTTNSNYLTKTIYTREELKTIEEY